VIKLGRISYVNMAPVFYRVDHDVEEIQGVPTELNRMLIDGELDTAPISSIEYARHADSLLLLDGGAQADDFTLVRAAHDCELERKRVAIGCRPSGDRSIEAWIVQT